MQTPANPLQLLLFTKEGNQSRTILADSLEFYPGYQVGDIIHLMHQGNQTRLDDHQYVVQTLKHIISRGETGADSSAYILLVEVVELSTLERDEPVRQSDYTLKNYARHNPAD